MQELTDPEFLPTMQWSIVVANEDFIRDEPETIRAVLRASKRSYEFCRDNPDEWARFAADWYGIDLGSIRLANERELPGLRWDCRPDLDGIQQAIDLQRRLGAVAAAIDAASLVEGRFLPS
jgi:NitT/TauT family transport system substrate-binding protein